MGAWPNDIKTCVLDDSDTTNDNNDAQTSSCGVNQIPSHDLLANDSRNVVFKSEHLSQ
jgi:hypothetical protein